MSFLASLTKKQWTGLLILLFLDLVCLYGGLFPVAAYWAINHHNTSPTVETADLKIASAYDLAPAAQEILPSISPLPAAPTPIPLRVAVVPAPTRTSTRTPTRKVTVAPRAAPSSTPRATATVRASPTPTATATAVPPSPTATPWFMEPQTIAELELNPRVSLTSRSSVFTSACFGAGANPLQDKDNMAPADWAGSPDRKCIFGYRVDPKDGMPAGRYSAAGGPEGEPRFYLIPPEAFASETRVKQLSQMQIIVDPVQGCSSLGSIGITADGTSYRCPACSFLRAGGMCMSEDGMKTLVLPTHSAFLLDPDKTGGAMGFQGFPVVFFRRSFSVYFSGKSGYAPPRVYFESTVDELRPEMKVRTSSEMSYAQIRGISSGFDAIAARGNPVTGISPLEKPVQVTSANPVRVSSKGTGAISFRAPAETVLSSIVWSIQPVNNIDQKTFLETNLCMDLNGERVCYTGVEDFAHCAFFEPCVTGFSSLVPTGSGGYVATRYFPPGAAPVIHDPNVRVQFEAPDIGTVLDMSVQLKVRAVDPSLIRP